MSDPRQIIRERAAERGLSYTALSIMAGRDLEYVEQYVERGTPRKLPEEERRLIAMALDVDEMLLGARMPWRPVDGAAEHHG
ncbi:hypothetical protein [Sphingomonas rubra]|uniref:HTH cro/C1-type domain-containing protein n=1 Tax=Sphingomonas rubra TaxID=634430 RepID=A0A1I5UTA0_9SPHN|nr:hypothetical protein [Sphingomonas rubra]SFP98495.1 hypothetical protein SAMN04488241_1165 [Sphingomonas rubra]